MKKLIQKFEVAMLTIFVLVWAISVGAAEKTKKEEVAPAKTPSKKEGEKEAKITFYGFPRMDIIYSDSRLNHMQYSMWALSEDRSTPGLHGNDAIDLYPRLTRFGLDLSRLSLSHLKDVKLFGKIEFDFQAGGSESRELPRLRHGYVKLVHKSGFLFLAGQTWDLISPLWPSVNADGMMWNSGNLGDRRPQVRFGYGRKLDKMALDFQIAFARTGAVDLKDLDGNGTRDGDDSGLPMIQFRAGLASKMFSFGIWGHIGFEETLAKVGGEDRFTTSSIGADFKVTLAGKYIIAGEFWFGENLSDLRGGIGQGVNAATGKEITSRGGWIEFKANLTKWYSVALGYALDEPENSDVGAGGRTKNSAFYFSNAFNLGGGFKCGIEYIFWRTDYKGLPFGNANRFDFYFMYEYKW